MLCNPPWCILMTVFVVKLKIQGPIPCNSQKLLKTVKHGLHWGHNVLFIVLDKFKVLNQLTPTSRAWQWSLHKLFLQCKDWQYYNRQYATEKLQINSSISLKVFYLNNILCLNYSNFWGQHLGSKIIRCLRRESQSN